GPRDVAVGGVEPEVRVAVDLPAEAGRVDLAHPQLAVLDADLGVDGVERALGEADALGGEVGRDHRPGQGAGCAADGARLVDVEIFRRAQAREPAAATGVDLQPGVEA